MIKKEDKNGKLLQKMLTFRMIGGLLINSVYYV